MKDFEMLSRLLDLIEDPKKYRTAITEMVTERKKNEAAVENVCKVKEITKREGQAQAALNEANAVLYTAKQQAKKTIEDAQQKTEKQFADLKVKEAEIAEGQMKLTKDRQSFQREFDDGMAALNKRALTLSELEKTAQATLNAANQKEEEFTRKLAQIKDIA